MSDNAHKGQRNKDIKRNKTIFSAKTTEKILKEPKGDLRQQVECTFCKKTDHHLDACLKFKTEALEKRLEFVKENRLCFGCLKKGHVFKDCRKRLTCSMCKKKHPTCLHGNRSAPEKKEDRSDSESRSVPKSTSYTSLGVSTTSTSMIVPVWLSASSRPDKELLVYAILDTQSDATFILKETCDELGAETEPTKLRLSTITSRELLVNSEKVSSLQVRGYNSDLKIPIPTA